MEQVQPDSHQGGEAHSKLDWKDMCLYTFQQMAQLQSSGTTKVRGVQDVFTIGERVRCLVMGMDDNFTRISLSTAELEENEGDIMFEKVRASSPLCNHHHM